MPDRWRKVAVDRLKNSKMEEVFLGSPVEAKFRGTTFRTGVVTNIRNDGTADITYEDVSLPSQN